MVSGFRSSLSVISSTNSTPSTGRAQFHFAKNKGYVHASIGLNGPQV